MIAHDGVASASPDDRQMAPDETISLATINTCFGAIDARAGGEAGAEAPAPCELSVRALNVLKLLAAEMTGEDPPRKDWLPSSSFLREVTFERLVRARNCGPLTAAEIVRWAKSRGVTIARPSWAGKSFSEMWRYLEVRFAAGEPVQAAILEALDRSVRRKSTRIPIAVQRMLLKLLEEGDGGAHRS
ncbi:hypothetical protein [Bradyrhizobium sp. Tv2a-2]|uniref:hypothetical protein n=1 Tax=Bradyrhizobium sp. Tv2a-2 TaxID=113395 RepID=UPI00040901F4|nr:hypothetical protein [Bradyrhizobium sp. Tv2a-2]